MQGHVEGEALSYRVALRPEMLRHTFVYEYDARGPTVIALREHPTSKQRNSEDLKITRRDVADGYPPFRPIVHLGNCIWAEVGDRVSRGWCARGRELRTASR
jgi:hypothetical protein